MGLHTTFITTSVCDNPSCNTPITGKGERLPEGYYIDLVTVITDKSRINLEGMGSGDPRVTIFAHAPECIGPAITARLAKDGTGERY